MKFIDKEEWERAPLFEKYEDYLFPYINLGAEIDVTGLYRFAKEHDISFYCAMIHAATKTALEFENFSYRIEDGRLARCEQLTPVFTYLPKGTEQFYLVAQPYEEDMIDFCKKAREKAESLADEAEHTFGTGDSTKEILYMSCIPWVKYTHFVRTVKNAEDASIPRSSWGKYTKDEKGRITMPFSVQVHPALMDGYHVGKYFERIEGYLQEGFL